MNVLVTGAAGRVGANMVRRLRSEQLEVRAMVMPGDPLRHKLEGLEGVEIVEADLGDQSAINLACKDVTHVIHLAAQLGRGNTPVDRYYDVNAFGTLRLLEGVVNAGLQVERFVLASSDGTYRPGDPPSVPMTEETPQEPADYYGTGKLLGEIILRNHAAQFDIPYSIVRFATVISPEEAAGMFQPAFWRTFLGYQAIGRESHVWQLFRDKPNLVQLFNDSVGDVPDDAAVALLGPEGDPWSLSVLDVRDAVEGVYLALTEPAALSNAFNLAAFEPVTHEQATAALAEVFGAPRLSVTMPMTWRLEVTVQKARDLLGFAPRYDYRTMLRDALDDSTYIRAGVGTGIASMSGLKTTGNT